MIWKMHIAGFHVIRKFVPRYSATHFNPRIVNTWKKILFSTSAPQPIATTTKKGFLLYHNHKFDPTIARIFVVFGTLACGISVIVSVDILHTLTDNEPEVSDKSSSSSTKIYRSSLGRASPYIYGITGLSVLLIAFKYVNSMVKKVLLSTDHKSLTFLTYGLFNKGKVKTFPVECIKFKGMRIKAKTDTSSGTFYLLKSGTITNKALFEWALGKYTVPKTG